METDEAAGTFQQPLHITVEQGTEDVVVELVDTHNRVLATMSFDIVNQILNPEEIHTEALYSMKQKAKGIAKPRVRLTMVVQSGQDEETGLLAAGSDVDILVRQQLKKAKLEAVQAGLAGEDDLSEMNILKQASAGPLELFEGLGKTATVYAAVLGPPQSRRYVLGIWNNQKDYENGKKALQEIDLLKIESIQGDPTRLHVFVVNCYDASRVRKELFFRRIDRARDVWVEILHLLVMRARDVRDAMRKSGGRHQKESPFDQQRQATRADRKTTRAMTGYGSPFYS